jgi:hypothetical protein
LPAPGERERERERTTYRVVKEPEPITAAAPNLLKPIERKMARAEGRLIVTEPPQSLFIGVYSFPLYETSLKAWMKLSIVAIVAGGILKLLLGGPG